MPKVVTHIHLTVVEPDEAPFTAILSDAMLEYNKKKKEWDEDPTKVYTEGVKEDDDMIATGQAKPGDGKRLKFGDHKPYEGPVPTLMQIVEEAHREAMNPALALLQEVLGAQVDLVVSTFPPELQDK